MRTRNIREVLVMLLVILVVIFLWRQGGRRLVQKRISHSASILTPLINHNVLTK